MAAQHNVAGLDIAVNDAVAVRFDEALEGLLADIGHVWMAERSKPCNDRVECFPLKVLHDQIDHTLIGLTEVVQSHGVWVGQCLYSARLTLQPGQKLDLGPHLGKQCFDGDLPVQSELASEVDHAHTAFGDDPLDLVATHNNVARLENCARRGDQIDTRVGTVGEFALGSWSLKCGRPSNDRHVSIIVFR